MLFFVMGSPGLHREVETNVVEITTAGRIIWIGFALAFYAVMTALGHTLYRRRSLPFSRFALGRAMAQLCLLLMAPLAYMILWEPIEGNLFGFFYVPYFLVGAPLVLVLGIVAYVATSVPKSAATSGKAEPEPEAFNPDAANPDHPSGR
jgi:hypothetical protein